MEPDNKFQYIDFNGTKVYAVDGIYHRLDGPAIEYSDGRKFWKISPKQMNDLSSEKLMEWIICYSHNFEDGIVSKVKKLIEEKSCVSN